MSKGNSILCWSRKRTEKNILALPFDKSEIRSRFIIYAMVKLDAYYYYYYSTLLTCLEDSSVTSTVRKFILFSSA